MSMFRISEICFKIWAKQLLSDSIQWMGEPCTWRSRSVSKNRKSKLLDDCIMYVTVCGGSVLKIWRINLLGMFQHWDQQRFFQKSSLVTMKHAAKAGQTLHPCNYHTLSFLDNLCMAWCATQIDATSVPTLRDVEQQIALFQHRPGQKKISVGQKTQGLASVSWGWFKSGDETRFSRLKNRAFWLD